MDFERMVMLQSAAHQDNARNRVIETDGWAPDTSVLDDINMSNAQAQSDADSWYAGVNRMRQQGHLLP